MRSARTAGGSDPGPAPGETVEPPRRHRPRCLHVFGKLVDEVKRRGHDGDTMYVITSDHGEELWDKGRIGHGQSLRHELVHVPLLIHYPPYFPPGRVVEEGVEVRDLLPTIAEALGVAPPEGAQGESLIPLAQGFGAGYPRPAIASQYELAHTMRLERWKMRVGGNGEVTLFDGVADPHEDKELSQARPIELRALTDAMGTFAAYRTQWKKRRFGVASNLAPGFSVEMDRQARGPRGSEPTADEQPGAFASRA